MISYPRREVVDLTSDLPITSVTTITPSLRSKVWAIVSRYSSSSSRIPPFSVAEIMVMAWVCRKAQHRDYITDEEVSDWTVLTFKYYKTMALKELYKHSFQLGRGLPEADDGGGNPW
jgi:hypothetical protein